MILQKRSFFAASALACGLLLQSATAHAVEARCREVGSDWIWFGDHAAVSLDYHVAGPRGRYYEIGTGVSFRGSPLGSKSSHEGSYTVTAWGVGAIHIRADDGGLPFTVCVAEGEMTLIPLCGRYRLDCGTP